MQPRPLLDFPHCDGPGPPKRKRRRRREDFRSRMYWSSTAPRLPRRPAPVEVAAGGGMPPSLPLPPRRHCQEESLLTGSGRERVAFP